MKTLDLHGTKHEDVRMKVKRWIEDNYNTGYSLSVITGNSPKMRELVIEELELYNLSWEHSIVYPSIINVDF